MTNENVRKIAEQQLTGGEKMEETGYGLVGTKGHCLGLTDKRLIIVRVSAFLGRIKEVVEIPRGQITGATYEFFPPEIPPLVRGYQPMSARFIIKTTQGDREFKILGTAGFLSRLQNFDKIKNMAELLNRK